MAHLTLPYPAKDIGANLATEINRATELNKAYFSLHHNNVPDIFFEAL
jgi:hypothetical protein